MAAIHFTEAESLELEALLHCGPLSPVRLIAEVKAARPWGDATVKTLLGRLMQKQAVRSEREDGALRHRALLERIPYVEGEVQALLDRLFGGEVDALTAFLAERMTDASDAGHSA